MLPCNYTSKLSASNNSMTKINDILKKIECIKCGNHEKGKFTVYSKMNIATRKTTIYLYCDVCETTYEIIPTTIDEYLLEPITDVGG